MTTPASFLSLFNLGLSIPNNVVTTYSTIRDVYLRIQNEKLELKELEHAMVNAWRLYAQLFNIQLQCKDRKDFEDQLKSLIIWCYDIEDLIDRKKLKTAATKDDTFTKTKEGSFELACQILKPNKVKELRERFGRIVKQWEEIHSKIKLVESKKSNDPYLSRSRLRIRKDDGITKCVEMLYSCDNGKGISIIGTSGLGKSFLARYFLDDDIDIIRQFPLRKLVHIKDGTFVWDDLKTEIEKCITAYKADMPSSSKTEDEQNRADMLIVFDNLLRLGDDGFEWSHFLVYVENLRKEKFINVKVIITTRNPSISQSTFTTAYYPEVLSDGDCEKLIKENVEFFTKASPSEAMVSTVKSVAKFCEGIPWVTERMGNLIAQQRTEADLRTLGRRLSSEHTSEFKEVILPHLTPCYIDMGPVLARCLAYLALFPKNHSFDRATLARLWVAECFFEMDKELTILQQIDKYVNELTARSILQLQPRGECCKPQHCSQDFDELTDWPILQLRPRGLCCKLQYCGLDFAMLAASGTCLHLEKGGPALSSLEKQEVRHLSLSGEIKDDFWTTLEDWKIKLRTFLSLYTDKNRGHLGKFPANLKKSLSRLRVFSLTETDIEELPGFMDALIQLRYLDISFTLIKKLPTKFPKNHPLQFLKFQPKNLSEYKWLPDEVHRLTNLRYVDWEENFLRAQQVPPHIGNLTHLENLPFFRVGTKKRYFISQLEGMDKLQGSICIENLENVEKPNETILDDANNAKLAAQKAMLHRKCGLRRIVLQWNSQATNRPCALCEGTLTGLEPHSNVKELIIRNYGGEKFPEWMSRSVLEKIELKACRPDDISAFGKMKNLKTLVLTDMESKRLSLRSTGDDETVACFPKLESIEFHNLAMLETWTGFKDGDFPRLTELKFAGCNFIGSHLPFIKKLKNSNPSIQVKVTYTDHFRNPYGCLQ